MARFLLLLAVSLLLLGFRRDNPAVDPVRFALWTLRDKAAQRRLALR